MDSSATLTVTTAVVMLTQFVKWSGLPDRRGPLVVMALSLLGVALWGFSAGAFEKNQLFGYFSGWVLITTSAAGVFGFTRSGADSVVATTKPPADGAGASPTAKG